MGYRPPLSTPERDLDARLTRLEEMLTKRIDDQRAYLQDFARQQAKIVMDRAEEIDRLLLALNDPKSWRRPVSVGLLIAGVVATSIGAA